MIGRIENVSLPVVALRVVDGAVVARVTDGEWRCDLSVRLSYQWLRIGSEIAGATSPFYVFGPGDQTASVSCRVTAHSVGGSCVVTSNEVSV